MKQLMTLTCMMFVLGAFAHLHKTEKPSSYVLIFQNRDTVRLNSPNDSLLQVYNDVIIRQKKNLVEAQLAFKAGEILTLRGNGKRWTAVSFTDGNNHIAIPDSTLKKITEIHLGSVAVVWSGTESRPFGTGYFYIRFDTGKEKLFERYPWVNFIVNNYKYSKAVLWRQTSEYAKDSKDF